MDAMGDFLLLQKANGRRHGFGSFSSVCAASTPLFVGAVHTAIALVTMLVSTLVSTRHLLWYFETFLPWDYPLIHQKHNCIGLLLISSKYQICHATFLVFKLIFALSFNRINQKIATYLSHSPVPDLGFWRFVGCLGHYTLLKTGLGIGWIIFSRSFMDFWIARVTA